MQDKYQGNKVYNGNEYGYRDNIIKKIIKTELQTSIGAKVEKTIFEFLNVDRWWDDVSNSHIYWDSTNTQYSLKQEIDLSDIANQVVLTPANVSTFFDMIGASAIPPIDFTPYQEKITTDFIPIVGTPTNGETVETILSKLAGNATQNTQIFNNVNNVIVNHNLNKYPNVTILDNTNTTFETSDIIYNSLNQFTISWNLPTSGTIIYN